MDGRGSSKLKLREPYGQATTQYRHPMQRCMSIITMPSARFQVDCVGQTRTHGGLSQWLQRTSVDRSRISAVVYGVTRSANTCSNCSFQTHFTSCFGSAIFGTLC